MPKRKHVEKQFTRLLDKDPNARKHTSETLLPRVCGPTFCLLGSVSGSVNLLLRVEADDVDTHVFLGRQKNKLDRTSAWHSFAQWR